MTELTTEHCEPCEGGMPSMDIEEAKPLLEDVPGWQLENVPKLHRQYTFEDFVTAMEFVNEMADISEQEGHHPVFTVNWNTVDVTVWTHAVDGLTRNDFILAAKLDEAAANYN